MGVEDKASNKFKDAKGKVKESAGKATDNEELEGEGKGDQAEASRQGLASRTSRTPPATSRTRSRSSSMVAQPDAALN